AIRFDFNELDIISGSLNQELYELSRVLPETEVEVGVSDSVHSQIRQAILPYPALLDRFDSIWDENDRDWWLKQIAPNDQHPYRISALAARKGWFDDRPDTLATLIKDKTPIGAVALNTALGLDIPGARKLKFQRNLSTLEHPVSRKEFPDLWDDTKSRLEKSWQANQWTLQLASVSTDSTEFLNGVRLGRMGDEQVMRAVVNAYVNHGIVKQWQDSSDFESQWVHLLSSFESSADIPSTEPEKRVAQARAWLESDWTYLPNRMTYRLLP
ncbi:MAG: hypothetical protein HRU46_11240, partial [Verrucomicrobiales bacterium]|nr:hypothetical protein [Verrucomicrobiales bacterium]